MGISYELGLRLPSDESVDCETQLELGAEASQHGYDALLTSETWGYDAFTRLGYLAATTNAILGTSIVPVTRERHRCWHNLLEHSPNSPAGGRYWESDSPRPP